MAAGRLFGVSALVLYGEAARPRTHEVARHTEIGTQLAAVGTAFGRERQTYTGRWARIRPR